MKRMLLVVALIAMSCPAYPEVKLPRLLSDGMVLQREVPLHFWGTATAGEEVTVTFLHHSAATKADLLGRWHIYFAPASAGGPYEVTIQGSNRIVLHDVFVGEVWVASGQSNMEFPMRQLQDADTKIAAAHLPLVHLLIVERTHSDYPLTDIASQGWKHCTPDNVREFSAVAYYFAREISEHTKVPLGIIESSWGGTVAEAWTSLDALASDASLMPLFAVRGRMMDQQVEFQVQRQKEAEETTAARQNGLPPPSFKWHPEPYMWEPAALFNAMIAPLTAYPIRGVIWYQGESNSIIERAPSLYGRQFETLIRDWRARWDEPEFPFFFVQIANFKSTAEEDWPTIREGQRKTLALRNTGMAVTIDIGNPEDVHPLNKLDVGHRLALIARAEVYRENVEFSGPTVRQITRDAHALRVWFDHTHGGLTTKGQALSAFEVAGRDGQFKPADARVDGMTVLVSNSTVEEPVAVRYGWANSPECNLWNGEGLAASPFSESLPPLH
jgi:sialate O-acetylesterase